MIEDDVAGSVFVESFLDGVPTPAEEAFGGAGTVVALISAGFGLKGTPSGSGKFTCRTTDRLDDGIIEWGLHSDLLEYRQMNIGKEERIQKQKKYDKSKWGFFFQAKA